MTKCDAINPFYNGNKLILLPTLEAQDQNNTILSGEMQGNHTERDPDFPPDIELKNNGDTILKSEEEARHTGYETHLFSNISLVKPGLPSIPKFYARSSPTMTLEEASVIGT